MDTWTEDTQMHAGSHATPAAERAQGWFTTLRQTVSDNTLLVACAVIGFAVSYQTISQQAVQHGLPGRPELYPILIDAGILAMANEARKAIADHRSDLLPRTFAWVLAGFTLYINVHGAPPHDWVGRGLHVVAPLLWIAFLELARWRRVKRARAERGDRIPLARWLLAPRRTASMKRRMVLNRVTSYPVASAREEARVVAIGLADAYWPGGWQTLAPPLLALYLNTGTLPSDVAAACENAANGFGVSRVGETVEAWIGRERELMVKAIRQRTPPDRTSDVPAEVTATAPKTASARSTRGRKPRQKKPRMSVAERTEAYKLAGDMLAADPPPKLKEVAAATGLSVRSLTRHRQVDGSPMASVASLAVGGSQA